MWVSRNQASSTVRNGVQWVRLGDLLRAKGKSGSARPQENAAGGEMAAWRGEVLSLPVDRIWPNPYQPRREFSEEQLEELAASIREHGILHPVVVRPKDEGYELVVGERRYRACRLLGWERIPAVVRDLPDSEVAALALIENLQRADLSFFEEAEGYRRLLEEFGLTQEELAKFLGKSQSAIANKLRLLRLEEPVRELISREMLSERHARALLRLESTEAQLKVVETVSRRRLNVRETELLIERMIQERLGGDGKRRRQSMKGVFKDYRLLRNSVKKLVDQMSANGAKVEFEEVDEGTFVEIRIRIHHRDKGGR
ncbi:MAG: nucleoid occlusion protein [Firmicutes bacterium]|nr:nucleoid occlusion protein [Bacillota bacterium]